MKKIQLRRQGQTNMVATPLLTLGKLSSSAWRLLLILQVTLATGGCQLTQPRLGGNNLAELESELKNLENLVTATREELQALNGQQSVQLNDLSKRLQVVDNGVKRVPSLISTACAQPELLTTTCDEVAIQTVVSQDDKMILGEVEHLWVNPPGLHLIASIDTGAASNLIHATNVTPFERDGEDWVRFELESLNSDQDAGTGKRTKRTPNANESVQVEERVVRQLRVSKRPVVRLRIKLGNVLDSFDFILTDRSDEDHAVLLGRNFLQDIALVDVGKQFVQPRFDSSNQN